MDEPSKQPGNLPPSRRLRYEYLIPVYEGTIEEQLQKYQNKADEIDKAIVFTEEEIQSES
jgi:hypothetical protein